MILGDTILADSPLAGGFSFSAPDPDVPSVLAYVSDAGVRWVVKTASVRSLHETPSIEVLAPARTWIRT